MGGVKRERRAEQHVGMARLIFRQRLHRDVYPVIERLEVKSGGPGIVDDRRYPARLRDTRDRRRVLDFEGERARGFKEDDLCARRNHRLDAGADARIEVARRDAVACEQAVAEAPRRRVDGVGHEHLATCACETEQRRGDGREAGWRQHGPRGAGNVGKRLGQRVVNPEPFETVALPGAMQSLDVGKQHGGSALYRRIHRAALTPLRTSGAHQTRGKAPRRVPAVIHLAHP
ncbi:MAG: hypothetical protein FD124_1734 [Alphaproteobacteria bacterium]|nr:MAG: hypothetical protein FD124_1734 [Alphaproteobacteria bacterium]